MEQFEKTPFEHALNWILSPFVEGGYSNHPADRGGETIYGISRKAHPDLWRDGPPSLLQAAERYKHEYWDGRGCDRLPLVLGIVLFDGEVNHRPRVASAILQQCLGVTADGLVGPQTAAVARRADVPEVLTDYLTRRARLYRDIVEADRSQAAFLNGWFARLFRLQRYCLELG